MTSTGHGSKGARKQEEAIAALLTCGSIAEAAKQCGLAEKTLDNWLKETEFARSYANARRRLLESAVVRLQRSMTAAVDALTRNLECGNPSVEVRAAATILETAFRGAELLDLGERLDELEGLVSGQGGEL